MAASDGMQPTPLAGLAGLVGLPTGLEARLPLEWLRLMGDPVWQLGARPGAATRPVLLIPGFFGSEESLLPMRAWLRRMGFPAEVAPVGLNAGPAAHGARVVEASARRLAAAFGRPVVIVGHSRGGQHGRVAAVRAPEAVETVVTLGTPLRVLVPNHASVRLPVGALSALGRWLASDAARAAAGAYESDLLGPLPRGVRQVSVWSKSDGIVDWRVSVEPTAENVRVRGSHLGLAVNREVYRTLVSVLEPATHNRNGAAGQPAASGGA